MTLSNRTYIVLLHVITYNANAYIYTMNKVILGEAYTE